MLQWIKIESLFNPKFYSQRFSREIGLDWQTPDGRLSRKNIDEYYNWQQDIFNNFSKVYKEEDFLEVKEFRVYVERYLSIDGLDNFIDLFLRINSEKKNKLKGNLNYFVNMLEIVKTLRLVEQELTENFPNLSKYIEEPKWYKPKYFFKSHDEEIEYNKKIFLEYGIFQEEKFVVFVEGDTELILLEDWLREMFYRTNIRISLKKLPSGKRTSFYFEYLIKDFRGSEFFLLIDADTPNYPKGKKAQLKGAGINEDSYKIFIPDFITANYNPEEVYKAFLSFFKKIKETIEAKTERKVRLSEVEKRNLLNSLKNKSEFEKYEKIVEDFLKIKLENKDYKIKKTDYASHVLDVQIKNYNKRYLFKEVLGKFIHKIQKIIIPDLDDQIG